MRRAGRPRESLYRSYRLNYDNPLMARRLAEHLREFRPDVVHFTHLQGLSASVISAVKDAGLPAVYTATDFWTICPVVDLLRHDGTLCTGPNEAHCPRCVASRQPRLQNIRSGAQNSRPGTARCRLAFSYAARGDAAGARPAPGHIGASGAHKGNGELAGPHPGPHATHAGPAGPQPA